MNNSASVFALAYGGIRVHTHTKSANAVRLRDATTLYQGQPHHTPLALVVPHELDGQDYVGSIWGNTCGNAVGAIVELQPDKSKSPGKS